MSSNQIKEAYEYFFQTADTDKDGFVQASEAVALFRRSGLADQVLGQIWGQVSDNQPKLDKTKFFYALGLIALAQAGKEPKMSELGPGKMTTPIFQGIQFPPSNSSPSSPQQNTITATVMTTNFTPLQPSMLQPLVIQPTTNPSTSTPSSGQPSTLTPSASSNNVSSGFVWIINDNQKQSSSKFFRELDPQNSGFVGGPEARPFFVQSNLPSSELAKIWSLSDVTNDGKLSLAEFQIAFFLVQAKIAGQEMPASLPQSILDSIGLSSSSKTASTGSIPAVISTGATTSASNSLQDLHTVVPPNQSNFASNTSSISASNSMSSLSAVDLMMSAEGQRTNLSTSLTEIPSTVSLSTHTTTTSLTTNESEKLSTTIEAGSNAPLDKPSTPSNTSSSSLQDWIITPEQRATYDNFFHRADELKTGILTGPQARELFLKAQLPNQTLADIWSLSDINKDGALDIKEFAVAMHLINLSRRGVKPPAILPQPMVDSVGINVNSYSMAAAEAERQRKQAEAQAMQKRQEEERLAALKKQEEDRLAALKLQQEEDERRRQQAIYMEQQAQMAKQQEDARQELVRARMQVANLMREKETRIKSLRSQQHTNIALAQQLIKVDYEGDSLRQEVASLELQVEKAKIKGASLKENMETVIRNVTAANEDKAMLEGLIAQKRTQYLTESAALATLETQLGENRNALAKQNEDINTLKASIAALQQAKDDRASRAFDPHELQQKLFQEKVKQDLANARASVALPQQSPAANNNNTTLTGSNSNIYDPFGSSPTTGSFGNHSNSQSGFEDSSWAFNNQSSESKRLDDFGSFKGKANDKPLDIGFDFEEDEFGKPANSFASSAPNQNQTSNQNQSNSSFFPSHQAFVNSGSFTPQSEHSMVGSSEFANTDFARDPSNNSSYANNTNNTSNSTVSAFTIPVSEEELPPPDDDFFVAAPVSTTSDQSSRKGSEEGEAKEKHQVEDTSHNVQKEHEKSNDPGEHAASASSNNTTNPTTDINNNPFPVEEEVIEPEKSQHSANKSNPFPTIPSTSTPSASSTNPFPMTISSNNPFPMNNEVESSTSGSTNLKSFDDLFADAPSETAVAFGSPDDFFGDSSHNNISNGNSKSSSTSESNKEFKPFDEPLFDD